MVVLRIYLNQLMKSLILLIEYNVVNYIITEMKKCEYYFISLDSFLDITQVDQLSFVVR